MISHRVNALLLRLADDHAAEIAARSIDAYHDLAVNCDSEIERLLLAPLMFIKPKCLAPRYEGPADRDLEARLFAQYPLQSRRLDFAYVVSPIHAAWQIKVGIECDGHAFHATREQRANDNMRGLEIAEEGFNVIRFTGSQINASPEACAQRVADVVDGIYASNVIDAANAKHRAGYSGPIGPLLAQIARQAGEATE